MKSSWVDAKKKNKIHKKKRIYHRNIWSIKWKKKNNNIEKQKNENEYEKSVDDGYQFSFSSATTNQCAYEITTVEEEEKKYKKKIWNKRKHEPKDEQEKRNILA